MVMMLQAMAERRLPLGPDKVINWRACDSDDLCQRVASQAPKALRPTQFLDGMLEKLKDQNEINAFCSTEGCMLKDASLSCRNWTHICMLAGCTSNPEMRKLRIASSTLRGAKVVV